MTKALTFLTLTQEESLDFEMNFTAITWILKSLSTPLLELKDVLQSPIQSLKLQMLTKVLPIALGHGFIKEF